MFNIPLNQIKESWEKTILDAPSMRGLIGRKGIKDLREALALLRKVPGLENSITPSVSVEAWLK